MRISDWSSDVCPSDLVAMTGGAIFRIGGLAALRLILGVDPGPDVAFRRPRARHDRPARQQQRARQPISPRHLAHQATPAIKPLREVGTPPVRRCNCRRRWRRRYIRSEEHTSELQSLMRISYAVFCLKQTT